MDVLDMSYPIVGGLMSDIHTMEHVWEHGFKEELRCDPSDFNVLMTDTFNTTRM